MATRAGVKGIFTMHGNSMEDIKSNKGINSLVENKKIETPVIGGLVYS